jgi:hypothetical protein
MNPTSTGGSQIRSDDVRKASPRIFGDVCSSSQLWLERNPTVRHCPVAVNLSTRAVSFLQLADRHLNVACADAIPTSRPNDPREPFSRGRLRNQLDQLAHRRLMVSKGVRPMYRPSMSFGLAAL